MRNLIVKLWNDDAGTVSLEYLLVATIVSMGAITGLATVSNALNEELIELGNAIVSIEQGYSYNGTSTADSYTRGSAYSVTNLAIPGGKRAPDFVGSSGQFLP